MVARSWHSLTPWPTPPRRRGGFAGRAALAAGFFLCLVAWLVARPGGAGTFTLVAGAAQILSPLLAIALCGWPLPSRGRRRAPALYCLALACAAIGQGIDNGYSMLFGGPIPVPSWADGCFLASYPILLLSILALPCFARSSADRARVTLDSLLLIVAGITFSWYFVLGPVFLGNAGSVAGQVTALAYPLGDLLVFGCVVLLAGRTAGKRTLGLRLLIGSLAALVATDSTFLRATLAEAYVPGTLLDLGWPLSYLLGALGMRAIALAPRPRAATAADAPPFWRTLLPLSLVPAMAVLRIVARKLPGDPALLAGVDVGAAVLMLLIVLRQALALVENQRLYRALQSAYTRLEDRSAALAELTATDPLTGLRNHRALLDTLDRELALARRHDRPCTIIFLDLDHFKALNDAHGHAAGDLALREFGQVAARALRATDLLGRWGGEEFLAILPQTTLAEGLIVAGRIRAAVAAHPFGVAGLRLTCSLGLAASPEHGADRDPLVAAADGAMYAAKRLGRDQVRAAGGPEVLALLDGPAGREETAFAGIVAALVGLAEERDTPAGRRIDAVGRLVGELAAALGCTAEEARLMALAGRLHDIGKVALPDAILRKEGGLTGEEWAQVRRHPVIGAELLERMPALRSLAPLVRGHHERWDGGGYPDQLAGEATPLGARIIAVADAYTAMIAERPHQPARTIAAALAELRACAGSQFDPAVVGALEGVLAAAAV